MVLAQLPPLNRSVTHAVGGAVAAAAGETRLSMTSGAVQVRALAAAARLIMVRRSIVGLPTIAALLPWR